MKRSVAFKSSMQVNFIGEAVAEVSHRVNTAEDCGDESQR